MKQAPSVIALASFVGACLGAGAGFAYGQLVREARDPGSCIAPDSRTGFAPVPPKSKLNPSVEDPALADYSWRRWPSLVDF